MNNILESIEKYLIEMRFVKDVPTRRVLYLEFQGKVVDQINKTILEDKDIEKRE